MSRQLLEFHAFYFYPVSSHKHVSILRIHPSSAGVLTFSLYIFSNKTKTKILSVSSKVPPSPWGVPEGHFSSRIRITLTVGTCSSPPWFCHQISDNKQFERRSVTFPHSLGGRPMGVGSPDGTGGSCPHFVESQESKSNGTRLTASCFDSVLPWTPGSDATHSWGESVLFNWPNRETPPQSCPEVCFHGDFKFHQI